MPGKTLILMIILALFTGCSPASDEETPMPTETFLQKISITQGTVWPVGEGWGIAVQDVGSIKYTDTQGQEQRGPAARLIIGNNDSGEQSDEVRVPVGGEFNVGPEMRFKVVAIDEGSSSGLPGSSTSKVYLGRIR